MPIPADTVPQCGCSSTVRTSFRTWPPWWGSCSFSFTSPPDSSPPGSSTTVTASQRASSTRWRTFCGLFRGIYDMWWNKHVCLGTEFSRAPFQSVLSFVHHLFLISYYKFSHLNCVSTQIHAGPPTRAAGNPWGLYKTREGLPAWYHLRGGAEETPHKTVLYGQKWKGECCALLWGGGCAVSEMSGISYKLKKFYSDQICIWCYFAFLSKHVTKQF